MTSGKWTVVGLLALGLLGVAISRWYYASVQGPAIETWGRAAVVQFMQSPEIEALRLEPVAAVETTSSDAEMLMIDNRVWRVVERRPAFGAPGVGYVGTALTVDRSFGQDATSGEKPIWHYALRYGGEHTPATIAFAPNCKRAVLVETGSSAFIAPAMPAIERVLGEMFPPEKSPSPSGRGPG